MSYGHASMLLLGEGSEATEPYKKYNKIRPHSFRSLQFDQKVRPLSFRPEKFDLFTATPYASSVWHPNRGDLKKIQRLQRICFKWIDYRNSFHQLIDKYHHSPTFLHLQMQDLLLFNKLTMGLYDFTIWDYVC